jgi:hypothetical protein
MSDRAPSKSALWLWLQIATAVWLALLRLLRTMPWSGQRPARSIAGVLMLAVAFGLLALGIGAFTRADTAPAGRTGAASG